MIAIGQKDVAGLGDGGGSLVFLVFIGAFDHRYPGSGSLLGPDPSGAVIATQLFNLEGLDAFDDVIEFGLPGLKQGNMQTAITAVGLVVLEIFSRI